jgi:4-hydroxy-tetrahydrodipicolinate synthase
VGLCRKPLGKMTRPGVDKVRAALREVYSRAPEALKPINEAFGVNVEKRLADDTIWAEFSR